MLVSGQISFKYYSEKNILDKSKEVYNKDYLYSRFRIGCEQDVRKDSLMLQAYQNYYRCFEEEIKDRIRKETGLKCCKSISSFEKHKRSCGCEDKCIIDKCGINVSEW